MSTEFVAQTGTRGCSYSFSEFALTNDTLTISTIKHVPVFIDEADLAQNPMFGQTQAAQRQGALLLDAIETAVLADHTNWTNLGLTGGLIDAAATDPITVSATNVDNIVRALRREVVVANGTDYMNENGLFVVWRADDMEFLEEYCQNSGFNLADTALKNGVPNGYNILGVTHYVSNSHAAAAAGVQHLFGGVKRIERVGILRSQWGKIKVLQDPASGVSTYGPVAGIGVRSSAYYGLMSPLGLKTLSFDINVTG